MRSVGVVRDCCWINVLLSILKLYRLEDVGGHCRFEATNLKPTRIPSILQSLIGLNTIYCTHLYIYINI